MNNRERPSEELVRYYANKLNPILTHTLDLLSDETFLKTHNQKKIDEITDFAKTVESILHNSFGLEGPGQTFAELSNRAAELGLNDE